MRTDKPWSTISHTRDFKLRNRAAYKAWKANKKARKQSQQLPETPPQTPPAVPDAWTLEIVQAPAPRDAQPGCLSALWHAAARQIKKCRR